MRTGDKSKMRNSTNVSYVFFTLLIDIKLCFDIRRKRVLLILFVLILNIKIAGSSISFNTPRLSRNIKIAHHK